MNTEHEQQPSWATGATNDYRAIGAQLCTRDGRCIGNAVSISHTQRHGLNLTEIVTDAGTQLFLIESELAEMFHPPKWLMEPSSHMGVTRFRTQQAIAISAPQANIGESMSNIRKFKICAGESADLPEPTNEMIEAGAQAAREYFESTGGNNPAVIYRAMRAAEPTNPKPVIANSQPFTDAQLKRLWNNSPQIAKDVTSCEAFKRVVRLAEAAHGMEVQS